MTILMTVDTVGGVWTYAVELARALDRYGVRVVLASMGAPPSDAQRAVLRAQPNIELRESTFALEWMADPWQDVAEAGEWLLALEREFAPAVVHLNGYVHAALPWRAPVMVTGHSCVLSWWRAVHDTDAPPQWSRYRAAVAAGLHAADLVVAPTPAMLDVLRRHYGLPGRSLVIANGVDVVRRRRLAPDVPADRRPIVLAAGRIWDAAKNLAVLEEAAPAIRWPVHWAGSDEHPDGGRRTVRGLRSLGHLDPPALRRWYRSAAVFVHPALYEPFGLAPLEAALHGCALVLADIPSLRQVWGDTAVFVPARNPGAIARVVNALIEDPAGRERLARAAHRRARRFGARRMARRYAAAYRSLLVPEPTRPEATACVS